MPGTESTGGAIAINGWKHVYSGKVRDLYESQDPALSHLILVVASDRVSAFDHVLEPAITGKGKHLTALTNWWFNRLDVPNHLSTEVAVPAEVAGRATVAKKLEMFPIECVVRGYISGSGWKDYQATGQICGVDLPEGLHFGGKLPEPIFTPAYKAPMGEHDENITFERVVELIGVENANALRDFSIKVFNRASELAEHAGLILADTKFEFGIDPATGAITLGDEVDHTRHGIRSINCGSTVLENLNALDGRNWNAVQVVQSRLTVVRVGISRRRHATTVQQDQC